MILKGFGFLVFFLSYVGIFAQTPLIPVGHAHNDYQQKRPLEEALENGFLSLEVDIFLKKGKLVVSHIPVFLGCKKTLEELYLIPLREKIRANGGTVYPDDSTSLILMLDIKSDASEVFTVLDSMLRSFPGMFSSVDNGRKKWGPVTLLNSGNKARAELKDNPVRFMVIDGNLGSSDLSADPMLFTRISGNFSSLFSWKGKGEIPNEEYNKLSEFVFDAHSNDKKLRFWKTKNDPAIWKILLDAGVDWINVDKLSEFRTFYLEYLSGKE